MKPGALTVDVILGVDNEVIGVHVDGMGAVFVVEEPYVHSLPTDSGWRVQRYRRYEAEPSVHHALVPRDVLDRLRVAMESSGTSTLLHHAARDVVTAADDLDG